MGGSGDDWAHSVALAPDGDVYVAGYTTSYDFPTTSGAIQRTLKGQEDIFVLRLSSNGTTLEWATLVGGRIDKRFRPGEHPFGLKCFTSHDSFSILLMISSTSTSIAPIRP